MLKSSCLFQTALIVLFCKSVQLQVAEKDSYSCKRIVHEKDRCVIFNYNHPDCKKWDHSNCPPPRVHKERGPCASYKCTRLISGWESQPTTTPTPVTVTTSTTSVLESKKQDLPIDKNNQGNSEGFELFKSDVGHANGTNGTNTRDFVDELWDEVQNLKKTQSLDVNRLDTEKDQLREDLDTLRRELLLRGGEIDGLEEDIRLLREGSQANTTVRERLDTQEIKLEEDLQSLEKKLLQLNATILEGLQKLESQVQDFETLVNRLHQHSNTTQVFFFIFLIVYSCSLNFRLTLFILTFT